MRNVVSMFDVPKIITASYYDSVDTFSREAIWQLCYRDLSDHQIELRDLSELTELCFNTETKFPNVWQAQADIVLLDGKQNLLGGGTLTGKGVKAAVIDRPINKDHVEFENRIEYIEVFPNDPAMERFDFHGMACASFLCGSTCGVAADTSLVYFAIPNNTSNIDAYYGYQLTALQKVIDYNKNNAEPIRVVSLSAPFLKEQMPLRDSLAAELEKTG